ncbi:hypothetical protein [Desulfurispira natronophila]|uniref:Putative membrane protein n=1 Tax=Desulfurispira natronophila TaxID=682562 RepID=A0A7W7Y2L8_9BACT|nr:hypothetical protein [Desulfurispira natronophila]MBB5020950.1 putative membrane protein [Desulfurispira natronophila]
MAKGIGRWSIIALSLAGAIFSLLNAFGLDIACVTQGCKIYSDYSLFGISFYYFGFAAFTGIFILALVYPRFFSSALLAVVIVSALIIDTAFLIYQYLYWPCASCMVVALLLGLIALAALLMLPWLRSWFYYGILLLWFFFFVIVGFAVAKELYLEPWALYGQPDAPVQVFVSPDCPACRELVRQIASDSNVLRQSAFYVISKDDSEREAIAYYLQQIRSGINDHEAFMEIFAGNTPEDVPPMNLTDRIRVASNTMALARMGKASVPLVIAPTVVPVEVVREVQPEVTDPEPDAFLPSPSGGGSSTFNQSMQSIWGGSSERSGSVDFQQGCALFGAPEDCDQEENNQQQ